MVRSNQVLIFRIILQAHKVLDITKHNLNNTVIARDIGELRIEDLAHEELGIGEIVGLGVS